MILDKSDQRLYLVDQKKIVSHYPAVYGAKRGRKVRQGDEKTPEGEYWICTINPRSKWHLFMGISYPNLDDAARGLSAGIISKAEYRQIEKACKTGKKPPWNTRLGGQIGIHGTRAGWRVSSPFFSGVTRNWTAGCIALDNKDIDDLKSNISYGIKIVIRK